MILSIIIIFSPIKRRLNKQFLKSWKKKKIKLLKILRYQNIFLKCLKVSFTKIIKCIHCTNMRFDSNKPELLSVYFPSKSLMGFIKGCTNYQQSFSGPNQMLLLASEVIQGKFTIHLNSTVPTVTTWTWKFLKRNSSSWNNLRIWHTY